MNENMNGKVALITGANKGIGYETARQLAKQGITVLLGARDEGRGKDAEAKLKAEGFNAQFIQLDLANSASIKHASQDIKTNFGKLDILVNNAGVNSEFAMQPMPKPSEVLPQVLRQTFDTNYFSVVELTQTLLPLIQRSEAGRIVNVSSSMGSLNIQSDAASPYPKILGYDSSKTALNAFTVHLADELRGTKIKVNSICPGWVKTDMGTDYAPRTVDQGAKIVVEMATLGDDGPTGGYFDDNGRVAW